MLARIENVDRDPRVTLLADHYEEDWSRLWWVRVDGEASVETEGEDFDRALTALRRPLPAVPGRRTDRAGDPDKDRADNVLGFRRL